jgi:hypothetical protein
MVAAVISDVHGNLPALEAVLADLGSVDTLVCCGDLVGYYPDVAEVVDRVRALGALVVRGNHELMALGARPSGPGTTPSSGPAVRSRSDSSRGSPRSRPPSSSCGTAS